MADQRQAFSGADVQVEVGQHLLLLAVAEPDVLETDVAFQSGHRAAVHLLHGGFHIDEGENPLGCRKPALNLRPKRGKVEHRKPETVQAAEKKIPRPGGHHAFDRAHAADIDQNGRAHAAQSVQGGEDQRKHEAAAHIDPIGLPVGVVEVGVDARFLPEVLGNGNAAHGFFDGRVDVGHGPHAFAGDFARPAPEA